MSSDLSVDQYKLIACSVAALSNTEELKKERLPKNHEYWSPSYQDICDAVDREIKYRTLLEEAGIEYESP